MQSGKKNELITVIIPIYNVEKYLPQCIDSVINQSYQNIEILLIDDGSTDESLKICNEYLQRDNRIRVIHQKNRGISVVRNVGVHEASGNVLFWVDSDDYIHPKMIERLFRNLIEYNADMSICNYTQGSERFYDFYKEKAGSRPQEFDGKQGLNLIYKDSHYAFIIAASWAKLIRKELYAGLEYPAGKLFEDIAMSHHLIQRCQRIVYTDEVMYYYYQWPESILGKTLHIGKLDYLEAFEERIIFFKGLGYDELAEKARVQFLHALIWEYSRAKDILHNKEMVKKIKRWYRTYYLLGTKNATVSHETAGYMFSFYLSPELTDFCDKVKGKLRKKV